VPIVAHPQIPLDGPREVFNRRRPVTFLEHFGRLDNDPVAGLLPLNHRIVDGLLIQRSRLRIGASDSQETFACNPYNALNKVELRN
jgi:hypothetical protein